MRASSCASIISDSITATAGAGRAPPKRSPDRTLAKSEIATPSHARLENPCEARDMDKISLDEKFSLFSEQWRPKVIAALNGQEVKIVKVKGEFPWHHHDNEDEFFMVWKGQFRVEFRDRVVALGPGECVVVSR